MRGRIAMAGAVLIACAAGRVHAGWELRSNGIGQTSGIIDISTPDPETAYAVGTHDTGTGNQEAQVWYTHTGGASWETAKPSTSPIAFYVSVFSPTALKAYVGSMRSIFITTDGGSSWLPSGDAGPLNIITGVGGYGEDLVVAVVSDGSIFRSTTGGSSWESVENPSGGALAGVFFADASTGWLRGGRYDEDTSTYSGGALLRTTDGGSSWETIFSGEPRTVAALHFLNPDEGWMLSNSASGARIEKTTDGGRTWTPLALPSYSAGAISQVWDAAFFDRCEGWLVASTGEDPVTSSLFHSTDGGGSWTEQDMAWAEIDTPLPLPIRGHPTCVDFSSRDRGYCGGFFEMLGTYSADTAAPDCDVPGPDPDGAWSDEGCGCTIVW